MTGCRHCCGGNVIRTDVLVCSPMFMIGLVQTLTDAGIKVVAERTSSHEDPSWLADALLIDVDAIAPPEDLTYIANMAKRTAVLLLTNESTAGDGTRYLHAGA